MSERKYLPTIGDLIDRLSISLMKSIFIDREAYRAEMDLIMTDLQLASWTLTPLGFARLIYDVQVNMLANRYIWENEAKIRSGAFGMAETDALRTTHSINGVRSRAKNEINTLFGERIDGKIDCLAADLPEDMGNWRVFED